MRFTLLALFLGIVLMVPVRAQNSIGQALPGGDKKTDDPKKGDDKKGDDKKGDDKKGDGKELKIVAQGLWKYALPGEKESGIVVRSYKDIIKHTLLSKSVDTLDDDILLGHAKDYVKETLKNEAIDFDTHMLVIVNPGSKVLPTKGVKVTRVEVKDNTAIVHWELMKIKPNAGPPDNAALVLLPKFTGKFEFVNDTNKDDKKPDPSKDPEKKPDPPKDGDKKPDPRLANLSESQILPTNVEFVRQMMDCRAPAAAGRS